MLSRLAQRLHVGRADEGSTLVSVLIIAMVLGIMTLTVSSAVVNTAVVTSGVRSTLQAQAAADAGSAAAFVQATKAGSGLCPSTGYVKADFAESTTAPRYKVKLTCATSTVTLTSTGHGEDGGVSVVESVYRFVGSVTNGTPNGAVVIGGGTISASSFVLDGNGQPGASAVLMSGDFNTCNSTTRLESDLVLLHGKLNLTNTCVFDGNVYVDGVVEGSSAATITGSLFSTGSVSIQNTTATIGSVTALGDVTMLGHVKGDIIAGGNVTVQGGGKVDGNIYAGGTLLTLNNATITGDIVAAGTGQTNIYNAKMGSIKVGGSFSQFGAAEVTRGIVATKAGATSKISGANGVKIGATSTIVLGGPIDTWGTNSWAPRLTQNATGLTAPAAPTITKPSILNAAGHPWVDYSIVPTDWVARGYEVVTQPATKCNFQDNPSFVTELKNRKTPTLLDLRACGTVNFYNVSLPLDTDFVIAIPDNGSTHSFQEAKITSADGEAHTFTIVMPDDTKGDGPTCKNSSSQLKLYRASLGTSPMISGLAYTPCKLWVGTSGSALGWNGQFYSGSMNMDGGGSAYTLTYIPMSVPSFGVSGSSAAVLGALQSRRALGAG
ncbi:bactofilin family protein [Microbacterium sp. CH-015]|uniref:bactofilin family protein n=1 Tax=Microbacterium sp. CH-015 TaxID=3406734 RepID=UPI003C73049E